VRPIRWRRRSVAIGAAVSAAYLAGIAFAWIQADRRSFQELHLRSMQVMNLMWCATPESFDRPGLFPRMFPWQRYLLVDGARRILSDTGWMRNDSLSSGDSGSLFEKRRAAIAGLSSPPGTDEARLAERIREAPESGYFGMLDARTIAAGRPVMREGVGYGVIVLADKRDLIAAKHVDHEIMLVSFALILLLPALLLALAYLRLVAPINRLAEAALSLDPADAGAALVLPGESRSDEIGLVSAAFGSALRDARMSRTRVQEFVDDVLHEMKNPVSSLRGRIELARIAGGSGGGVGSSGAGGAPAPVDLDRIASDLGRIERLMAALGALSAADSQAISGSSRPAELLSDLVGAYVELGKPVSLECALDGGEVLSVDQETFARLVRILLDNALDFSPPGAEVKVVAAADDSFISVSVADRGPGVPPGRRAWIFERFASTRKEEAEPHAGLGLAIARSLLSRLRSGGHQASIEVADNPGGGALFVMRLPRP
jgi:signal transduction histidine kinase